MRQLQPIDFLFHQLYHDCLLPPACCRSPYIHKSNGPFLNYGIFEVLKEKVKDIDGVGKASEVLPIIDKLFVHQMMELFHSVRVLHLDVKEAGVRKNSELHVEALILSLKSGGNLSLNIHWKLICHKKYDL
jgi:hypothetical protein